MRISLKLAAIAAVAAGLSTQAAVAQERLKKRLPTLTAEEIAKKKAIDAEYKKALKTIPDAAEKQDPWKTMR